MLLLYDVTYFKDEPLVVVSGVSVVQDNGKGLDNWESTKHPSVMYL